MKRLVRMTGWLAGLLSGLAGAEEAASRNVPLDIQSDRLTVFHQEHRAEFVGHVVAVQDDLTIRCDKLSIFYRAGKVPASLTGGVARMLFQGSVRIEQRLAPAEGSQQPGLRVGSCDEAEYKRSGSKLICTGDPWVEETGNRITGDRIVYFLDRKEVEVTKPRAVINVPRDSENPTGTKRP